MRLWSLAVGTIVSRPLGPISDTITNVSLAISAACARVTGKTADVASDTAVTRLRQTFISSVLSGCPRWKVAGSVRGRGRPTVSAIREPTDALVRRHRRRRARYDPPDGGR